MKLRKTLIAITASAPLLFIAGCSSPLIYSSVWQDKPVTVDGKAKEWKIPLDYFDDKTKLNFSITNDKTNLYFCIRATEDETQRGIIHTGLQIWIDTTGGKKNQVGIQFPVIDRSASSMETSSDKHSKSSSETPDEAPAAHGLKEHYAGTHEQMKLTGFSNATNGLAEVPNIYGINTCLNWDTNNIMIYEVCIPFNTFYKASLSPYDSTKTLGVSFVVNVKSKSFGGGHGGGDMGGAGGMGGMGGGMHGGGMGGGGHGGHGGGESSSSNNTESLTTHIKFHLAVGAPKQ
jgi:hypothetical protein